MEIITWDELSKRKRLGRLIDDIKAGAVIVYPTETAYGLGADPRNYQSVERIYEIKGRDPSKLLPLIACSTSQVRKFFHMNKYESEYSSKHWPGPHTLILLRKTLKDGLVFSNEDVAIRVSGSPIARCLARRLGAPIVSTSANISGRGACYDIDTVVEQFKSMKNQPDIIIDNGRLLSTKTSEISMFVDGKRVIVRPV